MSQQFSLMKQRRFLPFFLTQFFGAFNDNFYKNALVVLLTYQTAHYSTLNAGVLVNLCAGLFILPFFLFSATAGQIADKYEKSRLIRLTKLLEIIIMLMVCTAFALESLALLLVTLFLMGSQSSLFGPVKYALLPQHLRQDELIGGNALVESGTFLAILLGTIGGGLLISVDHGTRWVAVAGIALSILGYASSRAIPLAPAASPQLKINWNPVTETWRNFSFICSNRAVFLAILGISWFWFYGAMFLSQFPAFAKNALGGNEHTVTLLLAMFSIGIGIGSLLCERLSAGKVELGLVPFGSIGLSLFALDLWWHAPAVNATSASLLPLSAVLGQPGTWHVLFDLIGIGVFGGFYIVPLYALLQTRSEESHRSRVIAGNNIVNSLFMVLAAAMGAGLVAAGFSAAQLFLLTGLLNVAIAIYIYTLLPEFLLRFIVWLLVHSIYRLRVESAGCIPESGPALLLCHRNSRIDALIVMAASRRPMRFILEQRFFDIPLLGRLLRRCHAIPAASAQGDTEKYALMRARIAEALRAGELVVMFQDDFSPGQEISPGRSLTLAEIAGENAAQLITAWLRLQDAVKNGRRYSPAKKLPFFSRIALVCEKTYTPLPQAEEKH